MNRQDEENHGISQTPAYVSLNSEITSLQREVKDLKHIVWYFLNKERLHFPPQSFKFLDGGFNGWYKRNTTDKNPMDGNYGFKKD